MFSGDNAGPEEGWALRCSINWARRKAQLSPAGPAPTITTSVSRVSLSASGMVSGPRIAWELGSPAKQRPRFPFRIYHDMLQLEVDGRMKTDYQIERHQEITGLLRQAGELLLEGVGDHRIRAVFLLDLLVNLAGALGLRSPVNVGHGQQEYGS